MLIKRSKGRSRLIILRKTLLTMAVLLMIVYGGLVAYAYWPYPEGMPAAELAGPNDRFVEVDGINLRYRAWGSPDKPAIVLIHGFANSLQSFNRIAPFLQDDYYVLALDLPGFGLSDKPVDHNYGNASQAQVVSGFIKALKLQNVVVGGHSMGGAHAVHLAIDDPTVDGIILFNPGIITTGVPAATEYFVFPLPRLAAKTFGQREFRESFLKSSYLNPGIITDEMLDELMLGAQTDDYIEGSTALMSYYRSGNEVELLPEVKLPTLIVWGVEDKRKTDAEAAELQNSIAGSRLVRIEEAAHYVHEEQPQRSAQAIIDALDFWAFPDAAPAN
jgi:pimeloyl-ACP methyl ester carboxylesterase